MGATFFTLERSPNWTWYIIGPDGEALRTRNGARRRAWSTRVAAREMATRMNALAIGCPLVRQVALEGLGVSSDVDSLFVPAHDHELHHERNLRRSGLEAESLGDREHGGRRQ